MANRPIRITREQEGAISANPYGDLLVKGLPGSGKTLVIVHRGARLLEIPPRPGEEGITPVRIFSFNRMLIEWMKYLADQLGDPPLEIVGFHAWALKAINALGAHGPAANDFDAYGAILLDAVRSHGGFPASFRARHVLVDEGQDLSREALRALKMSATQSFTVAADKAQNIYETGFTWESIGIKVRGRVRSLDQTFRGTKQIARLAADLDPTQQDTQFDDLPEGPDPRIFFCDNFAGADRALKETVENARRENLSGTIAVLHARRGPTYPISKLTGGRILDRENPDMISPGVIVSTIHNVKGLEFDTVIIKDVNDSILPYRDGNGEEQVDRSRRVLYVAITRARTRVVIICGKNPSRFIAELDPKHYKRIDR